MGLDQELLSRQLKTELKELYDAGLTLLYVGIESGDSEVLQCIQKGETFETKKELPKPKEEKKEEIIETNNDKTLENARTQYEEKFKTAVPNRYKNNLDWIINKLNA